MADSHWPDLPLASWQDTRDTLQLWTQIAGKICLALTPASIISGTLPCS